MNYKQQQLSYSELYAVHLLHLQKVLIQTNESTQWNGMKIHQSTNCIENEIMFKIAHTLKLQLNDVIYHPKALKIN